MNEAQKLLHRISNAAERQVTHIYLRHQHWLGAAAWIACGLYLLITGVAGLLSGWAVVWQWLK